MTTEEKQRDELKVKTLIQINVNLVFSSLRVIILPQNNHFTHGENRSYLTTDCEESVHSTAIGSNNTFGNLAGKCAIVLNLHKCLADTPWQTIKEVR